MTEARFLASYDPAAFPPLAVTVDLVLVGVVDGKLCALLQQRHDHPAKGRWALPGGFVAPEEGLEDAALRVAGTKARMANVWLEQLYTFGAPRRDPRMRVVTVAYLALLPAERMNLAAAADEALSVCPLQVAWAGTAGGPVRALSQVGEPRPLAFDHADILGLAVERLRGKLDYAPVAFSFLPPRFTLRAVQEVHEAILGRSFAKPAFRRRILDQNLIEPTGEYEQGTAFRPAELYQLKPSKGA